MKHNNTIFVIENSKGNNIKQERYLEIQQKNLNEKELYENINNINSNIQKNRKINNQAIREIHFNNGRWDNVEHKKFIEAILLYGNEWGQVQSYIKTRSASQARSHAQKFFNKLKAKLKIPITSNLKKIDKVYFDSIFLPLKEFLIKNTDQEETISSPNHSLISIDIDNRNGRRVINRIKFLNMLVSFNKKLVKKYRNSSQECRTSHKCSDFSENSKNTEKIFQIEKVYKGNCLKMKLKKKLKFKHSKKYHKNIQTDLIENKPTIVSSTSKVSVPDSSNIYETLKTYFSSQITDNKDSSKNFKSNHILNKEIDSISVSTPFPINFNDAHYSSYNSFPNNFSFSEKPFSNFEYNNRICNSNSFYINELQSSNPFKIEFDYEEKNLKMNRSFDDSIDYEYDNPSNFGKRFTEF